MAVDGTRDTLMIALDLYKSSVSNQQTLWGLYSGACLGILGYVLGAKAPVAGRAKVGLAIGFAVFATAHGLALWHAQSLHFEAYKVVQYLGPKQGLPASLLQQLYARKPLLVVALQVGLSASTEVAILAAHLHDLRTARANVASGQR